MEHPQAGVRQVLHLTSSMWVPCCRGSLIPFNSRCWALRILIPFGRYKLQAPRGAGTYYQHPSGLPDCWAAPIRKHPNTSATPQHISRGA